MLPQDCPCPSPNCSGNLGTSNGTANGGAKGTRTEEVGQDNRYRDMQVTGPMGRADNQHGVYPAAWYNTTTNSYIGPNGYYDSHTGNLPLDPGTQGSMPNGAMPMKSTPAMSFVQFFPWLFKEIDPSAQKDVYRGIGTNASEDISSTVATNSAAAGLADEQLQNSTSENAQQMLICSDGSQCLNGVCKDKSACINPTFIATQYLDFSKCKAITNTCNGNLPDPDSLEVWSRLQFDSCSNQYILTAALTPTAIFNQTYRQHQYPWNESMCQPLNLKKVNPSPLCSGSAISGNHGTLYDYDAACYLDQAWYNVLLHGYQLGGGVSQGDQGSAPWANGQLGSCGSYIKGCSGGLANILGEISSLTGMLNLSTLTGLLAGGTNNAGGQTIGAPGSVLANPAKGIAASPGGIPVINSVVTNPDLAIYPYERIYDPTHPFSPRWDWQKTDRDFSQRVLFFNDPCGSDKKKHNVADENPDCKYPGIPFVGYDPIGPKHADCVVRCAAVPVDILSFRANQFSACMGCRIEVNTLCFWSEVLLLQVTVDIGIYYDFEGLSSHDAFNVVVSSEDGWQKIFELFNYDLYWGYMTPIGYCKDFFDTLGEWPLCSTKYDFPDDNVPFLCSACTTASGDSNSSGGVKKCCDDLAHPLVPINILKIRNLKEDPELAPVPEGYAFKEFFTGPSQDNSTGRSCPPLTGGSGSGSGGPHGAEACPHMPYMRWWDTGAAAGGTGDSRLNTNYDPNCDRGKDDVIVGVGIEGESCKYGGGGSSSGGTQGRSYSNGCITVPKPDAMTSWSELKHYQMNTIHDYGLSCIGQYEKLYKADGAEEGPLFRAGGYFNSKHYTQECLDGSKCGSGSSGGSSPMLCSDQAQCVQCGVSGGSSSGGAGGSGGSSGGNVAGASCPMNIKVNPWSLSWRGYLTELNAPCRFPAFKGVPVTASSGSSSGGGGGSSSSSSGGIVCSGSGGSAYNGDGTKDAHGKFIGLGLDNAEVGDIIYFNHPDSLNAGDINACADGSNCNGGKCAKSGESCTNNYVMPFMAIVTGVSHGAKLPMWPYASIFPAGNTISTGGWCEGGGGYDATTNLCTNGSQPSGYGNPALAHISDCPSDANCISTCSDYITVMDENNGKFPDVCGNTDYRGMGQPRTIYKEFLPGNVYEHLYPLGTTITSSCGDSYTVQTGVDYCHDDSECGDGGPNQCYDGSACVSALTVQNDGNCIDPKMETCTFYADKAVDNSGTTLHSAPTSTSSNLWNKIEIYRPTQDVRTSPNSGR